ncbi:hypothetical protein [Paenibacillus sp. GCM10012306]|uniref:hypothetical protein n=1 Tax=Paenibacillus sp. GCM10012306 TaxID=3317342 RepID=UPI00361AA215
MSNPKKPFGGTSLDNPEQYPTDQESLFEMYESEATVDAIPMEDLNLERHEEKEDKDNTKHRSSSEEKYNTGF